MKPRQTVETSYFFFVCAGESDGNEDQRRRRSRRTTSTTMDDDDRQSTIDEVSEVNIAAEGNAKDDDSDVPHNDADDAAA